MAGAAVCAPATGVPAIGATAAVRGTEVGLVWDHSVVVGEALA